MKPDTHLAIDHTLCGLPTALAPGRATVALVATEAMAADERGLVHGGFVFGAADYAAMLAVNDPNVVLGAAETRFLLPVVVGQRVELEAQVTEEKGKKRVVRVTARRAGDAVFEGTFTCFVLPRHVLAPEGEP
ncbi:MAG: PaaI family thioesterase [Planctomycetota bacterium]